MRQALNNPWWDFSAITLLSFQSFDICGRVGGVRKALKLLCTSQVSSPQMVPTEDRGARGWKQLSALLTESSEGPQLGVSLSSSLFKQNYGVRATGQQCTEAGDICAICQAEFREPLVLMCQVSRAGRSHWGRRPGDLWGPFPRRSPISQSYDQTSRLRDGSLGNSGFKARVSQTWVQTSGLPLTRRAALGKSLHLAEPWFYQSNIDSENVMWHSVRMS